MKNIQLVLAYDGTNFHGFQRQRDVRTVQLVVEEALEHLLGRKTRIIAAGRTDAGVHADGQVINFLTDGRLAPHGIAFLLAPYLPADVQAISSEEVPLSFHARFSAHDKTYRYELVTEKRLHPTQRHYKGHCTYPLDVERMRAALPLFLGEHEFSAFSRRDPRRSSRRILKTARLEARDGELRFRFTAESFLHRQVRCLVGALIAVGRGKLEEKTIENVLKKGAASPIVPAASACGLYLESVSYPK